VPAPFSRRAPLRRKAARLFFRSASFPRLGVGGSSHLFGADVAILPHAPVVPAAKSRNSAACGPALHLPQHFDARLLALRNPFVVREKASATFHSSIVVR